MCYIGKIDVYIHKTYRLAIIKGNYKCGYSLGSTYWLKKVNKLIEKLLPKAYLHSLMTTSTWTYPFMLHIGSLNADTMLMKPQKI